MGGHPTKQMQELFCQNIAKGMKQYPAYRAAGYGGRPTAASRLVRRPDVVERIKEIQKAIVEQIIVDKKWVVQQLVMNHTLAVSKSDISASNNALHLIGKELGMFIERRDIRIHAQFENMTDYELVLQLQHVTKQLLIEDHSKDAEVDG